MQRSIYDQAEKAKTEGIELVFRNANTAWKRRAAEKLMEVIKTHKRFTSDDVLIPLEEAGIVTKDNRAIAAILKSAARLELIKPTGMYGRCRRVSRHGAPVLIWQSLAFEE